MPEMWESSKMLVEAAVRAEPKLEAYFRMAWQERMAGGAGPAATQGTEGEQGPFPGRRSSRNCSKNEMRTEKEQAPWLGSQVIKHRGSLSNKWLLLISFLFIICWLKTNGGYGKKSGFSWKLYEIGGCRKGDGVQGKVQMQSSCFPEEVSCRHVCWAVAVS